MQRNVITIATGKKIYVDLAINLARSFVWWHPDGGIQFFLVTDREELLPPDVKKLINIISVLEGEIGEGFSTKLHLDKLVPDGKTIFIDSDCLIFGSLEKAFEAFDGHAVSVVGRHISDGEFFGDVASICRKFSIPHLTYFNGGVYYIEKGSIASNVYETARMLEKRYDEIGFVRLRNKPNDEVLMSLAMELNGQTPVKDDGTIMSDPQFCQGGYSLNVIKGKRWLLNPPSPHPLHNNRYPLERVSPVIVHFLNYFADDYPYRREVYRLEKALNRNLNLLTETKALLRIELPQRGKQSFKALFRPIYRSLFGYRKIRKSARI